MNTRRTLANVFASAEFGEVFFDYLDDCRTTSGYPALHKLELRIWRGLQRLGMHYPENCLLGIYQKM